MEVISTLVSKQSICLGCMAAGSKQGGVIKQLESGKVTAPMPS